MVLQDYLAQREKKVRKENREKKVKKVKKVKEVSEENKEVMVNKELMVLLAPLVHVDYQGYLDLLVI